MADPQQSERPARVSADEVAYRTALQKYGSDRVAQPCDEERLYIEASRGVDPHDREGLRVVARSVRPMPRTMAEAWDEWAYIDRRDQVKREFHPERGVCPAMAERAALLTEALVTQLQCNDLGDLDYRVRLLAALSAGGRPGLDAVLQRALARTMANDIERLKEVLHPAEPQQKITDLNTATERRAAVVAQLCDPETSRWSDRAIAKACGVSPQTVSNWRHKLSDQTEQGSPEGRERFYRRHGDVHRMKIRKIGSKTPKPGFEF